MPFATSDPLLRVTEEEGRTAIRFAEGISLTEENAEELDRELTDLVTGRVKLNLAFDLAGVEFLGSTALTRFIGLNRRVKASGGRLTLVNPRPNVREVFTITRLDRLFDMGPALPA